MRKLRLACIPVALLAVGMLLAPAASAAQRPHNFPGGQVMIGNNQSNINAYVHVVGNIHSGTLVAGNNGDTEFTFDDATGQIKLDSPNQAYCVYYNAGAGTMDILKCASKLSDEWTFGNPTWSEWISEYNLNICAWYESNNAAIGMADCSGTSTQDHWNWQAVG